MKNKIGGSVAPINNINDVAYTIKDFFNSETSTTIKPSTYVKPITTIKPSTTIGDEYTKKDLELVRKHVITTLDYGKDILNEIKGKRVNG